MNKLKEPIDYAKASCDTMMRKYNAEDLPPKGHFHYHQGVFLSGVYKTYQATSDNRYFQYMKDWVNSIVHTNGDIVSMNDDELDDIQPGILLFPLFETTGEFRYKKALDTLMTILKKYPKNPEGGFFHKGNLTNQMWLDGLYMAGPICAEYAKRFAQQEYIEVAIKQVLLMWEKTRDAETGLWYHAWDYTHSQKWADKDTGRSKEFWGRSMGWVVVAILDELDFIDETHPQYNQMCFVVRDLLEAICKYQSEEGRWYQVVDKKDESGNWVENSCSCLYVAAISKAVRKGILDKKYLEQAKKGFEAVIRSLKWEEEDLLVGDVCIGTGVGDYKFYCERPTSVNDLHGVGAFLIMCTEMQEWKKQ